MKYVAFLRGINVGGHAPINMVALRKAFELLGFRNVRTVLASGNVLFETEPARPDSLAGKIENKLKVTFKHEVGVLVRTFEQVRALADAGYFKKIEVTPQTRLYVTFLAEKPNTGLADPRASSRKGFEILHVTDGEVLSVLTLSPGTGSTDVMSILEKVFGRKITSRNWNTILKVLQEAP